MQLESNICYLKIRSGSFAIVPMVQPAQKRNAANLPCLWRFGYPVIYRNGDRYQLVDDNGIYEISFQNKEFIPILKFERNKENNEYARENIVYFFPEYTKIVFNAIKPSYLILHDNGEIAINIAPNIISRNCLTISKPIASKPTFEKLTIITGRNRWIRPKKFNPQIKWPE